MSKYPLQLPIKKINVSYVFYSFLKKNKQFEKPFRFGYSLARGG